MPSCDTLPMAPIGGMPVSPTTRAATAASTRASGTARIASHTLMPKSMTCIATASAQASARPATATGVQCVPTVRRAPRSCSAKLVPAAVTMSATPGHSSHSTSGPKPAPAT